MSFSKWLDEEESLALTVTDEDGDQFTLYCNTNPGSAPPFTVEVKADFGESRVYNDHDDMVALMQELLKHLRS